MSDNSQFSAASEFTTTTGTRRVQTRVGRVLFGPLRAGLTDDLLARLLTFPKVIVTSHMGALTWEALGEIAARTLASLTEFEQGKNLTQELRLDGVRSLPGD